MRYLILFLFVILSLIYGCNSNTNSSGPVNPVEIIWEQTGGPFGVSGITAEVNGNGTLFIAGDEGVYVSTNEGDFWNLSSLKGKRIDKILSGNNNEVVASGNGAIYISSDNGINWIERKISPGLGDIVALLSYKNKSIYLIAGSSCLYYSTDDGIKWIKKETPIKGFIRSCAIDSRNNVFIGTLNQGMFYSVDNGDSWVHADTNITGKNINLIYIDEADIMYINSDLLKFAKSDNKGASWQRINNNFSSDFLRCMKKTQNGFILAGGNSEIYISSDQGNSWMTKNFDGVYTNSILISNNNIFLCLNGGGFVRSRDKGFSWEEVQNGIKNANIFYISTDKNDNVFAGAIFEKFYYSTDKGNVWQKLSGPLDGGFGGYIYVAENKNIYTSLSGKGMYVSSNNGISWKKSSDGNFNTIRYSYSFKEDSRGGIYTLSNEGNLLHSSNKGESWEDIKLPCSAAMKVEIDINDNILIVSGNPKDIFSEENLNTFVYVSTNEGRDWLLIKENHSNEPIYQSASDRKGNIYLSAGSELFRITGSGLRWTYERILSCDYYFSEIITDKNNNLYASADSYEIFFSENNGFSWQKNIFNKDYARIQCMSVDSKGNLFIGTSNKGVFRGAIIH
jgi:photosystem II stability/assembly factor-like uncharacterized protein